MQSIPIGEAGIASTSIPPSGVTKPHKDILPSPWRSNRGRNLSSAKWRNKKGGGGGGPFFSPYVKPKIKSYATIDFKPDHDGYHRPPWDLRPSSEDVLPSPGPGGIPPKGVQRGRVPCGLLRENPRAHHRKREFLRENLLHTLGHRGLAPSLLSNLKSFEL